MSLKFFCCSLCVVIVLCCAAAFEAAAQIPRTLTYQGVLKKADGSPVVGPVTLTVSLFTTPIGGTAIWGPETHQDEPLTSGVYTITLGKPKKGTPVPLTFAFDKPSYLQVAVGGVMIGRHALTSVPYALRAASLDQVTINTATPQISLNGRLWVSLKNGQLYSNVATFESRNEEPPYISWQHNRTGGVSSRYGYIRAGDFGNGAARMEFVAEQGANFFFSGGKVGIGTTTPQYALDVSGTIRGSNVIGSDVRWKSDIAPLKDALAKVTQLRGVTYRWNDAARGAGMQIGLIAQEVEPLFPELVSTDSEGYKSVAYAQMVAPLIEAVKTLNAENEALKTENAEILRRLAALEAQIANQ